MRLDTLALIIHVYIWAIKWKIYLTKIGYRLTFWCPPEWLLHLYTSAKDEPDNSSNADVTSKRQ